MQSRKKNNLAVGGQQVKATEYKRIELLDREKPPEHYDHTDLTTFRKTNKQGEKIPPGNCFPY